MYYCRIYIYLDYILYIYIPGAVDTFQFRIGLKKKNQNMSKLFHKLPLRNCSTKRLRKKKRCVEKFGTTLSQFISFCYHF